MTAHLTQGKRANHRKGLGRRKGGTHRIKKWEGVWVGMGEGFVYSIYCVSTCVQPKVLSSGKIWIMLYIDNVNSEIYIKNYIYTKINIYICTYIYTIHVWIWVYDLQMDLYVCLRICKMVTPKLKKKKKKKNGLQSNDINHNINLESDSKHQYNPVTPTVDNRMQLDQQIWKILTNGCLPFMMNVSDNTRLSNTIHRSSITKYVLLGAQQKWPAQCNNAQLFTVVHYLC